MYMQEIIWTLCQYGAKTCLRCEVLFTTTYHHWGPNDLVTAITKSKQKWQIFVSI